MTTETRPNHKTSPAPVYHYKGPASVLTFTQASDLRLTPTRNHPAKDLGPWFVRDRFAWILAEYSIEDPLDKDDPARRKSPPHT